MADKNFLTEIIDADLAEGKVSEIHTRFPPEPNGYLHIGSAKAIYINWSIANQYGGKFNLRLDDTNPAREGEEYGGNTGKAGFCRICTAKEKAAHSYGKRKEPILEFLLCSSSMNLS